MKFLILIFLLIGMVLGTLMYINDYNHYRSELAEESKLDHKMYCGFADFYLSVNVSGADTSTVKLNKTAQSYVKIMSLRSTSRTIYRKLSEKYDSDSLGALLNKERYQDKKVDKNTLYGKNYGIRSIASGTMLEIRVCAEEKAVCKDLLTICCNKLKAVAKTMNDSSVAFEGKSIRHLLVESDFFKKTDVTLQELNGTDTEQEEDVLTPPGISMIAVWALIGLLAGIILAIAAAIFVPTLNRPSDFDHYGVEPLGCFTNTGVPMLICILKKKIKDPGVKTIILVSTVDTDKRIKKFISNLQDELNADGINLRTAGFSKNNTDQAVLESEEGIIISLERKGVSRHYRFDEMQHYIGVMGRTIEGAVLLS